MPYKISYSYAHTLHLVVGRVSLGAEAPCLGPFSPFPGRILDANFAEWVNEEVRLVGISTGSYPSVGLRVRVHTRRIAVSFIIRAYSKWEDRSCPTSPKSSSVS